MLKRLPSLLEILLLPLAVIALIRWQKHEQETLCDAYMQAEYGETPQKNERRAVYTEEYYQARDELKELRDTFRAELKHVIMVDGKIDRWEDKLTT